MSFTYVSILSSTANATSFFLSSLKLVNYLKMFVPNQHQNFSKIFVCYQIRNSNNVLKVIR